MKRLEGKTVIITGAAGGLGQAFAIAMAKEGANIVAADLRSAESTVAKVQEAGGNAVGVETDVTNGESTQAMAAKAVEVFGRIDILVNNAGILPPMKPIDAIEEDEWDLVNNVNIKGVWLCAKAVLPQMREQGSGRIINISSTTYWEGVPLATHYVATKGAVLGFTRSLARELSNSGINVNAVAPGLTITPTTEKQLEGPVLAKVREHVNGQRIIQRDQTPEDIAGTVIFLASDDSRFITGQTILVDGGGSHN